MREMLIGVCSATFKRWPSCCARHGTARHDDWQSPSLSRQQAGVCSPPEAAASRIKHCNQTAVCSCCIPSGLRQLLLQLFSLCPTDSRLLCSKTNVCNAHNKKAINLHVLLVVVYPHETAAAHVLCGRGSCVAIGKQTCNGRVNKEYAEPKGPQEHGKSLGCQVSSARGGMRSRHECWKNAQVEHVSARTSRLGGREGTNHCPHPDELARGGACI